MKKRTFSWTRATENLLDYHKVGGHWTTIRSQSLLNKSICPGLSPENNENVTHPLGNVGAEKEGQKRLCANLLNALPVISLKT